MKSPPADLLATLAEKIAIGSDDVIGLLLTVMSGSLSIDTTSEQLHMAVFQARAALWFRRER